MCSVEGIKKKTAHCLRVTCSTTLFNAGIEEKLIRERTVRRSNTLFQYETANREQVVQRESIRKLSNFNFQRTKTLYQIILNNIAFFFTFFKGYRYN